MRNTLMNTVTSGNETQTRMNISIVNLLLNTDYKKQHCIVGFDKLVKNIEKITKLYQDPTNDFFIIDNVKTLDYLFGELDKRGLSRMKCFTLLNESEEILINYFKMCYLSCENYEIIKN